MGTTLTEGEGVAAVGLALGLSVGDRDGLAVGFVGPCVGLFVGFNEGE